MVSNLQEALADGVSAAFCTTTAPLDRTIAIGESLYDSINFPGLPPGPTPAGQALRNARNLFCNEPPDNASSGFFQPFEGGQCEGTQYRVMGYSLIDGVRNGPLQDNTGPGPLTYESEVFPTGGGSAAVVDGEGNNLIFGSGGMQGSVVTVEVLSVDAVSGPDDCGSVPEEPNEPYIEDNFTTSPTIVYEDNNQNNQNLTVPLVFAPVQINNDLQVEVPVRARFDTDIVVDGTVNLSTGNVTFNTSFNIDTPTNPDDETVIVDPESPGGDPPTEGESIEKTIIGVYIKSISIDDDTVPATELLTTTGSEFWVPRLATISFHCEILSAPGLGWTEDVPLKYGSQIIYCPVPWGAKSVSITEQPGVTVSVVLIRAQSERDLLLRAAKET